MPANVNVNEDILKKIYHINSGVCSGHSYLVPATHYIPYDIFCSTRDMQMYMWRWRYSG